MHCFAKDIAKNFLPHIFFLNHCNKSPLSKYKMNETIQHTDVTVFAGWKPVAAGLAVTRTAVLREFGISNEGGEHPSNGYLHFSCNDLG